MPCRHPLLKLSVLGAGLLITGTAAASCSVYGARGIVSLSMGGPITVPANAPNGAVLRSTTFAVPGGNAGVQYATCDGSGGNTYWAYRASAVQTNRMVTTTSSGIGYHASLTDFGPLDVRRSNAANTKPAFAADQVVTVELIKTGAITPGTYRFQDNGVVGSLFVGESGVEYIRLTGNDFVVQSTSCQVATKTVSVDMGTVTPKELPSVSSVSPRVSNFSLELNCQSGSNVYLTLTDNQNTSNTSDRLGLAAGSTASGVAIQVLKDGAPVNFGPDSSAPGTLNQIALGAAPDGKLTVPLAARYVRTGDLVPGNVQSVATFTFSYQ
ncbi:type 1 fimbrial protein [Pseudomonas sp. PDNC002]|uniref:fimbrial protein n=1 Tax=Pseudomonas sp. PDNC002 TaxID=2811422 RepID=UPI001962ADD3|nr:fimbrial protein [Pseudomonas sp. PDNC002]QRY76962.1 type 1 fimbrial protein [Pseudomonas sp. PDNC002]